MIQIKELIGLDIGCGFEETDTGRGNLKLKTKRTPYSIVQKEFDFLYNLIVDNNLKNGYEACTGVGISALAAGLAMKKTGGKVITLDAYIEETVNSAHYSNAVRSVYENSDGYKTVISIIEHFGLHDNLIPFVGWTPDDVPEALKNVTEPLDYVFIDGGHFPDQVIKDIEVLLNYTNENTHWVFHDCDEHVWTQNVVDYVKEKLNKKINVILPESEGCCNLGILK